MNMNLSNMILADANLCKTSFTYCDFTGSSLVNANLEGSQLWYTVFSSANLENATLNACDLQLATFRWCTLRNTDFSHARFAGTVIGSGLNSVKGLDTTVHHGPSIINTKSILSMKNNFSEHFLRGCGLLEDEINYYRQSLQSTVAYNSCFICYSTKDEAFASMLHRDLQVRGIRCWKWDFDAKTGQDLWAEVDGAINKHDKLLLIASKNSLVSPAVNREIERALQKEDALWVQKHEGKFDGNTDVLFPIRLDDFIFESWNSSRKADVVRKLVADARDWLAGRSNYEKVLKKIVADLSA